MWQITWMLSFLPDWFWTFLFVVGIIALIAGMLLKKIPFVSTYQLPLRIGGVLAILVSTWFLGAASNEEKWQHKIKELEEKVAKAEQESKDANTKLASEIEEKKKLQTQKGQTVVKYLDRWNTKEVLKEVPKEGPERVRVEEVIKYIENCPVPKELLDLHNEAAKKAINDAAKKGDKQ